MITLTREEAQQVLDALENLASMAGAAWTTDNPIETLRARLSAPDPDPVAWLHSFTGYGWQVVPEKLYPTDQPLYTAPPQRDFKFSTIEEAKQSMLETTGMPQLDDDEMRFANAFTTLIKAGYGKEATIVLKGISK